MTDSQQDKLGQPHPEHIPARFAPHPMLGLAFTRDEGRTSPPEDFQAQFEHSMRYVERHLGPIEGLGRPGGLGGLWGEVYHPQDGQPGSGPLMHIDVVRHRPLGDPASLALVTYGLDRWQQRGPRSCDCPACQGRPEYAELVLRLPAALAGSVEAETPWAALLAKLADWVQFSAPTNPAHYPGAVFAGLDKEGSPVAEVLAAGSKLSAAYLVTCGLLNGGTPRRCRLVTGEPVTYLEVALVTDAEYAYGKRFGADALTTALTLGGVLSGPLDLGRETVQLRTDTSEDASSGGLG